MEIFLASCFWRLEFSPSRPHLVFLPSRENFSCFPSAGLICEERAVFRFSAHVVQTCSLWEKKKKKNNADVYISKRIKTNMWTFFTSLACIGCSCCWERAKWAAGMMGWWWWGGSCKACPTRRTSEHEIKARSIKNNFPWSFMLNRRSSSTTGLTAVHI